MWDLTITPSHDFYVTASAAAVLVHNCDGARFSVNSAATVTDSQGLAGVQLNQASGDAFRDTVAGFLWSQGRTVTTDAENRSALTFQALGKSRLIWWYKMMTIISWVT
jgi:hypothetical protein